MSRRLSTPLYESLPWLYAGGGLSALGASWLLRRRSFSELLAVAGIAGVLFGSVLLLRRRDYRDLRSRYGAADLPEPVDRPPRD